MAFFRICGHELFLGIGLLGVRWVYGWHKVGLGLV